MSDPRTAETLGEACVNEDGTYDGAKLLSWLSEILNPGHGVSESETRQIVDETLAKRRQHEQRS
jgi:hypothetical protein